MDVARLKTHYLKNKTGEKISGTSSDSTSPNYSNYKSGTQMSVPGHLRIALLLLTTAITPVSFATSEDSAGLYWQGWSNDLFQRAKAENKFVILDLEAIWCHWCHVMEETTYKSKDVAKLLKEHYITVRVDQDTNPDLLARYGQYGWPATIVFAADGSEIVKRRGYIPPIRMASLLQAIIDDPSPGPSIRPQAEVIPSSDAAINQEQRKSLEDKFYQLYDPDNGGWGFIHKFINANAMDYALQKARYGDRLYTLMAKQTLHAALDLIDPVWGGAYQYSDKLDWQSPHFEKIMSIQTRYLRIYSQAYLLWGEDKYLDAARKIHGYLQNFLKSDQGLYYTSQDADLSLEVNGHEYFPLQDEARRKLGMPRIDKNIYSKDNGWIVHAFVAFSNASGDAQVLNEAIQVAAKVEQKYGLPNGGFRHGENDLNGPFLEDSEAMANAYLSLYSATGNRQWLLRAGKTLQFVEQNFRHDKGGYISNPVSQDAVGVFAEAPKNIEQMIALARTANLAYRYIGDKRLREMAEHAMLYLTSEGVIKSRFFLPGVLLSDRELNQEPIHITVVGKKTDTQAKALHDQARRYGASYLRIDWLDRTEGPLLNNDVVYPELDKPAAYACSSQSCSLPVFDKSKLSSVVDNLLLPL